MSFEETKYEVCVANRALFEVGLTSGPLASLGHISMRVPGNPDRFIVKGRGYEVDAIPLMEPEGMVVCDLDGNRMASATTTAARNHLFLAGKSHQRRRRICLPASACATSEIPYSRQGSSE